MSPPEIWGPAVWVLFHTLTEKISEEAFPYEGKNLFNMIVQICKFLPCPDCASDATIFLSKIKISEIQNKIDLKNKMYFFHNYVNHKKRKPLFQYSELNKYTRANVVNVINNFIIHYQTKGNMKLLSDSFQRQFVINDLKAWLSKSIRAFYSPIVTPQQLPETYEDDTTTY